MDLVATTATWMAALMAAWTVVTGMAGARRDVRLEASGARGLHAGAALLLLALVLHLVEERRGVAAAPLGVASLLAARTLWTDVVARLVGWALAVGLVGAVVPSLAHRFGRDTQLRAQVVAAVVLLLFAGAAATATWVITPTAADDVGTGPVAIQVWPGIVARLLYLAGMAALVVPLSLWRTAAAREMRVRWALGALASMTASLVLGAWVRYALAAPPAELDPNGVPFAPRWTTMSMLWVVPPLVAAAHAAADAPGSRRGWLPRLFALLAAGTVLAVLAPALYRWTQATEVAPGLAVHPPLVVLVALPVLLAITGLAVAALHGRIAAPRLAAVGGMAAVVMPLLAIFAGVRDGASLATIALAGASGALIVVGGMRGSFPAAAIAGGSALLLVGATVAAISSRPVTVELQQGAAQTVDVRGDPWRLTSQGASQVEQPLYDAALVALEAESPGRGTIVTTGERIYRDAHGHAGTRIAVPGLARGVLGDLRIVVLGLRGEGALAQVQYHTLATVAWILAVVMVASLGAAVFTGPRRGA